MIFLAARLRALAPAGVLAMAFATPAIAQLPILDWLSPREVRMPCPVACRGFQTCRQNEYTVCSQVQQNCFCRRVRGTVIPP